MITLEIGSTHLHPYSQQQKSAIIKKIVTIAPTYNTILICFKRDHKSTIDIYTFVITHTVLSHIVKHLNN